MNQNDPISKLLNSICENPEKWDASQAVRLIAVALKETRADVSTIKNDIKRIINYLILVLISITGSLFASAVSVLLR